ncbi:type II secretion system protein F [Brachybacterium vulturis]|uniref:Type II secretion system protein F n=1 Tax=Brachybacterium vulturis TaxID=2017484 RepID=A0A291GMU2_9MICO|nr:type II secretion system F family protein [Brachybacterium vulturis]ATG51863.1 type II secretion system protein F [Brachybacterium vulturis]
MSALVAAVLLAIALGLAGFALLAPGPPRLSASRRRPADVPQESLLSRAANALTAVIAAVLRRRGQRTGMTMMEEAGLAMRSQDFVFLVIIAMIVLGGAALVAAGPLLALLVAVVVPVLAWVMLGVLAGRRRKAFADQLEETLQQMASGLRAGHSMLTSIASVTEESDSPTREEYARILNETRVGRDVGTALSETAARMQCQDFEWVAQAIAINREVGGNLADVLDGVGDTIRERGQIRRQVEALAAEGKLSAVILMALPFGVGGFLMLTNPDYLRPFIENPLGWILLGVSTVMLIVGGLVMRSTVRVVF